jgi:hypothetical protein
MNFLKTLIFFPIKRNLFYGGEFSSHQLTALIDFDQKLTRHKDDEVKKTKFIEENCSTDNVIDSNNDLANYYYTNFEQRWHINEE